MSSLKDFVKILRKIHRDYLKEDYSPYLENYISYDQVMFFAFDDFKIRNDIDLKSINRDVHGMNLIRHNRYRKFSISKKSGGERIIYSPEPRLMLIQKCINVLLQSVYGTNSHSHGFIWGRSIITNARNHIGQNFVFNMDLENFFQSIHQPRIWKRLQLNPFNLKNGLDDWDPFTLKGPYEKIMIANAITNICCYKPEGFNHGILPTGAPTSPILSNIICERLDRRLAGLCKSFSVIYSRYADDITFSSSVNIFNNSSSFLKEVEKIIVSQNFRINPSKSRLFAKGYRQEVTGLVVNEKINVRRSFVKNVRSLIFLLEKYGDNKAQEIFNKFDNRKISNDSYLKKLGNNELVSKRNIYSVIDGKINFLKMVKGDTDSTYNSLKSRFDNLIQNRTR